MASLPTPGGSDGTYGTELNAYLVIGHATDGTHNEAGLTAQMVNIQTGAVDTGTTVIPDDDTIPQITEGDEYMTLAITPANANNELKIEVVIFLENSAGSEVGIVALFQDTTANALAASTERLTNDGADVLSFTHYMTAGTTSSTTFRVRAGAQGQGTITFNGQAGARKMGGVMASSITITEIWV